MEDSQNLEGFGTVGETGLSGGGLAVTRPDREIPIQAGGVLPAADQVAVQVWRRVARLRDSSEQTEELVFCSLAHLWPKVGRALRAQTDAERFANEEKSLAPIPAFSWRFDAAPEWMMRAALHTGFCWRNGGIRREIASGLQDERGPLVYLPVQSERLQTAMQHLRWRETLTVRLGDRINQPDRGLISTRRLRPSQLLNRKLVAEGMQVVTDLLRATGITLLERDQRLLRIEMAGLVALRARARLELETVRPRMIVVLSDNHPPHQAYVQEAKAMGIRSLMLQHGLDCELAVLDEAYADVIAAWGAERVRRYRANSQNQRFIIEITGNPEYDSWEKAATMQVNGKYWLWVTRPHSSDKCYLPSRWPDEGAHILEGLLECMVEFPRARLVIKPHPYDVIADYRRVLATTAHYSAARRVSIEVGKIRPLLVDASLVITEDSTAGLEAMLMGKPVIHAHFAESPPAMPFAKYGGAFPAYNTEMMHAALKMAVGLIGGNQMEELLARQRRTINDLAGECDGKAAERVAKLVEEAIK